MRTVLTECLACGQTFSPLLAEVRRGKGRTCSKSCRHKLQSTLMSGRSVGLETRRKLSAAMTGRARTAEHSLHISTALTGKLSLEKNPNWRGGSYESQGRFYVRAVSHPFAHRNGYILRSRQVAEQIIGRLLSQEEQVHHINFIKHDDRPENLYVFASAGDHTEYHQLLKSGGVREIRESNLLSCKVQ